MYALEMLIDAAPGFWNSAFSTANAWQQWFALLSSRSGNLTTLVKAASALVVSADASPDAASSADPNLDPEVASLIGDWTSNAGGVADAPAEILRLMLGKPSLFAESRALLLTRLRAPTKLPPDFLRVQSVREVDAPTYVGGASRLERSTLSLGDVLLKDAGPTSLGFLEVLGNEKYDFQFLLDEFKVFEIEAFLKSPIPDPSVAPHPLNGPVHVPAAAAGNPPRVDLPSRQPLVSPVHLYTDNVSGMEQENWALQFTGTTQLSVSGLQDSRTIRKAQGGEAAFVLRAASVDFARSTLYNRAVIAGLFYVISDETNEFENDAFRFAQKAIAEPIGQDPETLIPAPAVVALFKAFEGNSVLRRRPKTIASCLSSAVKFCNSILDGTRHELC